MEVKIKSSKLNISELMSSFDEGLDTLDIVCREMEEFNSSSYRLKIETHEHWVSQSLEARSLLREVRDRFKERLNRRRS